MIQPTHQIILRSLGYAIGGFLFLGAVLDALGNSVTLITPTITFTGTALLVLGALVIQVYLKWKPLTWVSGGHSIRIHRLGIGSIIYIVGMILLLWLPRALPKIDHQEASVQSPVPQATKDRPWITVANIDPIDLSKPPSFIQAHIRNIGKEMAFDVISVGQANGQFTSRAQPEPFGDLNPESGGANASRSVLGPGQGEIMQIPLGSLSPEQVKDLIENRVTMYVFGRVKYRDSGNNWHELRFCSYYQPTASVWALCSAYNDAS